MPGIPADYLDAIRKGEQQGQSTLKFCPHCWMPGTPPDSMWTYPLAKYCFVCASQLRDRCENCDEAISSLKFRFCPYC